MEKQAGFATLSLVIILTCASIYAVSYYVCNDKGAPVDEVVIKSNKIKKGSFIEPEDKFLFV